MRVIALLATYNERRFVGSCIEHLRDHGVDTYLIDNDSSDETVAIAERYLGRGLIGIESMPRAEDSFNLTAQLRRKEEVARELEADWFIHLDADELRLPPPGQLTLAEALENAGREGYNAVNFVEFTFIPTREEPDHDHADFRRTLRTYYPFSPRFPHKLSAWQATGTPEPEIASTGGHMVRFPGLRMYPESFPMVHYLFLSVPHAVEKYVRRRFDQCEVEAGWHGWRARIDAPDIRLPARAELRVGGPGEELDHNRPRRRHYIEDPHPAP